MKLGNVNAFCNMKAKVNGKVFSFNGTTLDLTKQAIAKGAVAGDKIKSELGSHVLEHNKFEDRIPEKLWACQLFKS